jgi:hypothetical protein
MMQLFGEQIVLLQGVADVETALQGVVDFVSGLAVPAATLSVIVILFAIIVSPVFAEWDQSIRTGIIKVVLALVAIGFMPALITAAAAITGVG